MYRGPGSIRTEQNLCVFAAGELSQGYSVELNCGTGTSQVTLEPNRTLELGCSLAPLEQLHNVTWRKNGLPLVEEETLRILPNGSLLISSSQRAWDQGSYPGGSSLEGNYSCISRGLLGSVAGQTVALRLSSEHSVLSPFPLGRRLKNSQFCLLFLKGGDTQIRSSPAASVCGLGGRLRGLSS